MSIYTLNENIAFDHDQGAYMIYENGNLRMLPAHFVSRVELSENHVVIVCETKFHKERIRIEANEPVSLFEKLQVLMENF